jgi:hypothetical protein
VLLGTTAIHDIAIPDTHTAFILPFLDGDCIYLDGQWVADLSRYAFDDDVLRSSVLMLGANHNFYNSMWSPGTVGGSDDADSTWGEVEVERLTQVEQRLLGSFYLTAFFRLILGEEQPFLALFDGSLVRIPILPMAVIKSSAHFPTSSRYVIQSFETLYNDEAHLMPGNWTWEVRQGMGQIKTKASLGSGGSRPRYAHDELHSSLNLRSVGPLVPAELELRVREGSAPVDISGYTYLNFHVAYLLDDNTEVPIELRLALDGATIDLSSALSSLWPVPEIIPGVGTFLQQQVSIPLMDFNIDLSRPVERVLFTLPRGGDICLSDIVFAKPSLGNIRSIDLPFVSLMGDTPIVSTGSEQDLQVQLSLSAASLLRVTMRVEFTLDHRVLGVMKFSTRVAFEPGELSTTAHVIIPAGGFRTMFQDQGPDGKPCYAANIDVRALSNALFDRSLTKFLITPHP